MSRWLRLLAAALLWGGAVTPHAPAARTASAQTGDACVGAWDDAVPSARAVVVMDCAPGFASARDRIHVYPRSPTLRPVDWRDALDTRDAVWAFDAATTGRASLVIDFHPDRAGTGVIADLYDDQNGDAAVAYALRDGVPAVTESRWPTVTIAAPDGWWVRDGRINFNLDIDVDGPVRASFGSGVFMNLLKHDGRADYRLFVRDENRDGKPDWQLNRAYPPVAEDSAVYRSELMASAAGDFPTSGGVFWPYLGSDTFGIVKPYLLSPPPIQVNWKQGRITNVGEFVASRSSGSNWFIYSVRPFGPDDPMSVANFENPFAFYDLAGSNDGYPDLQIRNSHVVPGELVELAGATTVGAPYLRSTQPINVVRYSWDQDHNHSWDFKVDLLGRHATDDVVRFPGFSVQTVPYDRLPRWVVEKEWDAATFIATERELGWTSEGIYEWSTAAVRGAYLAGEDPARAAVEAFSALPNGLRGEYKLDLNDQPYLYTSEVDGRLHLKGAQAGTYSVGGGRVLRYESVGGQLIDRWISVVDGQTVSELSYVGDQLMFENSEGLHFKTVAPQRTPLLLLPPADSLQWNRLRETVSAARLGGVADDPAGLFARYAAPLSLLPGASMSDLRQQDDGFRFALHLPPSEGAQELPAWVAPLKPGDYSVTYASSRGYVAQPLTPADLSVTNVSATTERVSPLELVQLKAAVVNRGTAPADNATVALSARRDGEPPRPIGVIRLDVPGAGSATGTAEWAFPTGGVWTIEAEVAGSAERTTFSLTVDSVRAANADQLMQAQGRGTYFGLVVALVLAAAASAAAFAGASLITPRRRG
jgi:hypothetical protein